MIQVSALFVDPKGPYPEIPGVDWWDESRDAFEYTGQDPVVLHPPCGRWCRMAYVNQKRWGAMVGDDGGAFAHALLTLFRCGGVLEHPAYSIAWKPEWFNLPRPGGEGWTRRGDLWACEVWQSAYGHQAHKKTWLLYTGANPPWDLNWTRDRDLATHQVGGGIHTGNRLKPRLKNSKTHLSPRPFAEALVALARNSGGPPRKE